jgi:hypothetical protein
MNQKKKAEECIKSKQTFCGKQSTFPQIEELCAYVMLTKGRAN